MPARLFEIDRLSRELMADAHQRADRLARRSGRKPALAIIEIGDDANSHRYIDAKMRDCATTGIDARRLELAHDISWGDLLALIRHHNEDPRTDALMVQLPIPGHLDTDAVMSAIGRHKDADGLNPANMLALQTNNPGVIPCTVRGIAHLLVSQGIPIAGARMTIIGRGALVGLPAGLFFGGRSMNAEVTILHSRIHNIGPAVQRADIVISACGVAGIVKAANVREGAVVIDVGMSWPDGALRGDVDPDVAGIADWMTPPNTSFGAMTRAMLLHNVLDLGEATMPHDP